MTRRRVGASLAGIPTKLRFGAKTIPIVLVSTAEACDREEDGAALLASMQIRLDESLPRPKAAEILLHEIRHFLWDEWGLGESETEERANSILTRAECWFWPQNRATYRWIGEALGIL